MRTFALSTRLAVLLAVPLAGMACFGGRSCFEKWRTYHDYAALAQNSAVLQQIGHVVHELQRERGRSAVFLGSRGGEFGPELSEQRRATEAETARLEARLATFNAAAFDVSFQADLNTFRALLRELPERRAAITSFTLTPADATAYYTRTISTALDVVIAMSHLSRDAAIANGISCYVNFLQAKEQAGIERAVLAGVFTAGRFSSESLTRFSQATAAQDTFLRVFRSFADAGQRQFADEQLRGPAVTQVEAMRRTAMTHAATGDFGIKAREWFDASTARIALLKKVEDRLATDYATRAAAIQSDAARAFTVLAIATAVMVALAAGLGWFLARSTTRALQEAITELDGSSRQVAAASAELTGASQSLAQGSSEQASSLEETAASLEEISSMAKRNADAATCAQALSGETRAAAETGSSEIQAMTTAMADIRDSAHRIGKIVKSIDEIAFQTNLLALNAAVEAARAGEAGAGFAIVADEVRALARRSADAARETAERIGESLHRSEHGVEVSGSVARRFTGIVNKAREVDTLVAEIAGASREQTTGIQQVNTAVTQMDKVVQATAANAEETAAAAEELNAQSQVLYDIVGGLSRLIEGRSAPGEKLRCATTAVRPPSRPASAPRHLALPAAAA
jgi:methyl-accepting chemotaxis protein